MSGFSAQWLALREPHDQAARSGTVLDALAATFAGAPAVTVTDLACGTGVFEWVDLDSVYLLEPSVQRGGFHMKGPKYSVKGIGPGTGL